MRYFDCDIVFKEIPDEVSLCFSMIGCKFACPECHWKNITINDSNTFILNNEEAEKIINKYKNKVTCILFLGGEWFPDCIDLLSLFKKNGFKTALYTGLELNMVDVELLKTLDYIKVGKYIHSLGGLESKETNQILYRLCDMEILNCKMWRK